MTRLIASTYLLSANNATSTRGSAFRRYTRTSSIREGSAEGLSGGIADISSEFELLMSTYQLVSDEAMISALIREWSDIARDDSGDLQSPQRAEIINGVGLLETHLSRIGSLPLRNAEALLHNLSVSHASMTECFDAIADLPASLEKDRLAGTPSGIVYSQPPEAIPAKLPGKRASEILAPKPVKPELFVHDPEIEESYGSLSNTELLDLAQGFADSGSENTAAQLRAMLRTRIAATLGTASAVKYDDDVAYLESVMGLGNVHGK